MRKRGKILTASGTVERGWWPQVMRIIGADGMLGKRVLVSY
jgi:hypothetical protein